MLRVFTLWMFAGMGCLLGQQTTVTLTTSANPAVFGQSLALTATINPPGSTGKVSFYDGATVLGTSAISAGKAMFSTTLLQAGNRPLRAYYSGDASHVAAISPVVAQKVATGISNGFTNSIFPENFPYALAVGDFNGDGKPDIAVLDSGITILIGNGDGTFTSKPVPYSFQSSPEGIAVGDFNLDGKLDIALTGGPNLVSVLLGNGDGTFQTPVLLQAGFYGYRLAVGDFNGDGKPDLVVTSGNLLNTVWILLGNGDGTFQTAVSYATDSSPSSVAVGDYNGDGIADLAIACTTVIDVFLGAGSGTFPTRVSSSGGLGGGSLMAADFNGDGKLDLAEADQASGGETTPEKRLNVLLGNGDGTFGPPVAYATGPNANAIAVSDSNGDGKLDLAVTSSGSSAMEIFLGRGDGTFDRQSDQNPGFANQSLYFFGSHSIIAADFDGNGLADIAAGSQSDNTMGILLGSRNPDFALTMTQTGIVAQGQNGINYILSAQNIGWMTFTGQVQLNFTMGAGLVVTGVLSPGWSCTGAGNGYSCNRSDTLAAGQSFPPITVTVNVSASAAYHVTSTATLTSLSPAAPPVSASITTTILQSQTITFPAIPSHTFGDPSFKISVSSSSGLSVTVLSSGNCGILGSTVTIDGAGTCTLTATQAGDSFWAPAAPVVRTFSIGGSASSITLSVNASSVQFGKPVTLTATISPPRTLDRATFFDGTTILGVSPVTSGIATFSTTLLSPGKHSVSAYYGGMTSAPVTLAVNALGISGFASPAQTPPDAYGQIVTIGDFNGDGRADVAMTSTSASGVFVLLGNGDGTFQASGFSYGGLGRVVAVAAGDFNGDGKTDLVMLAENTDQFSILLGRGDGTFQDGVVYSGYNKIQQYPSGVAIADFNGDGKADLAISKGSTGTNTISIVVGNGDGTFGTPADLIVPDGSVNVTAGDFNGDGKADLAILCNYTVGILLGNGDGTFQPVISMPSTYGSNISSFVAMDLNNDGKLDLAFTKWGFVGVLIGNGNGTFRTEQDIQIPDIGVNSVVVSDLNEDQKSDLVLTSQGRIISLPGNGDGTFAAPVMFPGPIANALYFYTGSADFNGDGKPDLAVGTDAANVTILLGSGATALNVALNHSGNFAVGQTNAAYSIVVQNTGSAPTAGLVTVNGVFPSPPFLVQAMAGSGWTCSTATLQCTRNDSLPAGSSYPAINVTLAVAGGTGTVTSQASVSGGGVSGSSTNDSVTILATSLKFVPQPSGGAAGASIPPVIVQMQDPNGNLVIGSSSITVTSSPSGVNATTNAVNGVATFSGLSFIAAGTYTFTATAIGLTSATSNAFNMTIVMTGTKVGVFRGNVAFLEDSNGNGAYDPGVDRFFTTFTGTGGYVAGDIPVVGDWTGDGKAKVGIYRASTGTWFLDANNNFILDAGDFTYQFGGVPGDTPFVGDWNGLGKSCIGVFRQGFFWVLDLDCNGSFDGNKDAAFPFGGLGGDVPVVGAWTGGTTKVGVVRKYAPGGVPQGDPFYWVPDNGAANAGPSPASHQPDYTRVFAFGGLAGDVFVTGDWYSSGTSAAGVYRAGFWVLDAALPGAPQANHVPGVTFGYGGSAGDVPVVGKW